VSLMTSFGQRTRPVDRAPLFQAPLFRPDGIQGRGTPLIPCTKVARCGALPYSPVTTEATMTDATLGIDVSKKTLDANCVKGQRRQSRAFAKGLPQDWECKGQLGIFASVL